MERVENREICKDCGLCCLKCGCDYFICDIKNQSLEAIEALLDSGAASIIATLKFSRLPSGQATITPILSIRARNKHRGAIDLLSLKTACALLTETGCPYKLQERPSGGAAVIPQANHECLSSADKIAEIYKWDPLQKKLGRIVKRKTGKSVFDKLDEDVENFFYDILMSNFEDVMDAELKEVEDMLLPLSEVYPEALARAKKRSNQGGVLRIKHRK